MKNNDDYWITFANSPENWKRSWFWVALKVLEMQARFFLLIRLYNIAVWVIPVNWGSPFFKILGSRNWTFWYISTYIHLFVKLNWNIFGNCFFNNSVIVFKPFFPKVWKKRRSFTQYKRQYWFNQYCRLCEKNPPDNESAVHQNLAYFKGKSDHGAWKICKRVKVW